MVRQAWQRRQAQLQTGRLPDLDISKKDVRDAAQTALGRSSSSRPRVDSVYLPDAAAETLEFSLPDGQTISLKQRKGGRSGYVQAEPGTAEFHRLARTPEGEKIVERYDFLGEAYSLTPCCGFCGEEVDSCRC